MSQVPAATRALRVLRFLAGQPDPVPSTGSRAVGLPRSTAYHLIGAMIEEGFVVHLPDEHRYGLGVAAFEVGSGYARQEPLQRITRRHLAALVDRVGQTAHLAVLHGRDVLYVLEERAPGRPPLVTDVGVRLPAHLTASGRAILAALPAAQVRALYPDRDAFVDRHGLGPSSLSALRSLLSETRQRGYATEDGRGHPGLRLGRRGGPRPQPAPGGRGGGHLRRGRPAGGPPSHHRRHPPYARPRSPPGWAAAEAIGDETARTRYISLTLAAWRRTSMSEHERRDPGTSGPARRRLAWSVAVAVGAVVGATVMVPSYGQFARDGADLVKKQHDVAVAASRAKAAEAKPHVDPPAAAQAALTSLDGHSHNHADPTTKNSISRTTGDRDTAETRDPTTPMQAAVAAATVADQRREPSPKLVPMAARPDRATVPQDRYAMASGCYGLQSVRTGTWVKRDGDAFRTGAGSWSTGTPLHFQATDLGRYLLYGNRKDFVAQHHDALGTSDAVESADSPSEHADWTVTRSGSDFLFRIGATYLSVAPGGRLVMSTRHEPFRMHTRSGCAAWPEVQTNVSGRPFKGVSPIQEVRGTVDAHTHGMAFEFLGGDVHCGRPWHPYGVTYALKDCPDHYVANGSGAALEDLLNSGQPGHGHDPVGWPTFKDWPAPHSLTHEGTYYKWMERSWRGGLRIFTNLLVENDKLCQLYPIKRNSCDDMNSIAPAGQGHAPARALRRRAVRRPRQGLVPHRHRPLPGAPGDQPGQARRGHGHRDQRAVRLHDEGRRPRPVLHEGVHRPAAHAGPQDGRLADGAGQQVRQRAVRRRR